MNPSKATLRVAYPVLGAPDMAVALRFYEHLGFQCRFTDDAAAPRYAAVRRDAVELHLQWMADIPQSPDGDRPITRIVLDDVDRLYGELSPTLRRLGVMPSGPFGTPADAPWGTREWHVHDPAGNGLQFYHVRTGT